MEILPFSRSVLMAFPKPHLIVNSSETAPQDVSQGPTEKNRAAARNRLRVNVCSAPCTVFRAVYTWNKPKYYLRHGHGVRNEEVNKTSIKANCTLSALESNANMTSLYLYRLHVIIMRFVQPEKVQTAVY